MQCSAISRGAVEPTTQREKAGTTSGFEPQPYEVLSLPFTDSLRALGSGRSCLPYLRGTPSHARGCGHALAGLTTCNKEGMGE